MLKNKPRTTELAVDEPRLSADDLAKQPRQIRLYVASCVDDRLDAEDIIREVILLLWKVPLRGDSKSHAFAPAKNLISHQLNKGARMSRTVCLRQEWDRFHFELGTGLLHLG